MRCSKLHLPPCAQELSLMGGMQHGLEHPAPTSSGAYGGKHAGPNAQGYSISDMARDFNVSLRTLRFYEHRGLLTPRRDGTNRIYGAADRARLQRILKGKQLGFTLAEIREMLAGTATPSAGGEAALDLTPEQVFAQLTHLEQQRRDIEGAIQELRAVQQRLESA
jgi:DNA-binding transcriptional MerR regulator